METPSLKTNPLQYGIEETKAKELLGDLSQIIKERDSLIPQFNEILKMDIEDLNTSKRAKELRGIIKNNRTKGIEPWHKAKKEVFLRGGQFIDAKRKEEVLVNTRMEEALEDIENHAIKKEAERKELLKQTRIEELKDYAEFVPIGVDLSELAEEEYQKVFIGAKLQTENKIEAEIIAEQERLAKEKAENDIRIAKEKADTEERERQRLENERLKAEAEKREKEIEAERKDNEQKLANERAKAKEEADKIEAKNKADLKAEQDEKDKIKKELQDKKEAEDKAENERKQEELKAKEEAEKLAKAPIKKQLSVWVDGFSIDEINIEHEKKESIKEKFEAFKKWAIKEIESI